MPINKEKYTNQIVLLTTWHKIYKQLKEYKLETTHSTRFINLGPGSIHVKPGPLAYFLSLSLCAV